MIPDQRSSAPTDGGYAYFFDNGYWVPKPEAPFDIYKDYGLMLNERKAAELAKSIEDMKRWNASDSRQVRDLVAQKENRDAVVAMYRQGRIHYIGLAANKPTVKGDKDTIYDFLAVNCNVIIVKLDRSEFPKAFVVQDSAGK